MRVMRNIGDATPAQRYGLRIAMRAAARGLPGEGLEPEDEIALSGVLDAIDQLVISLQRVNEDPAYPMDEMLGGADG